ncbi:MAG: acylneuraminate cytidylyltransferase family protein [Clostridia bacterium]|jgi:CMP-N-acetylneuraminic acid synthetase
MNYAFIPARKGSVGIPGKNKKDFCGKPLVQWSIDQAKESKLFDKIIVSSDDEDILEIAKKCKVTAVPRVAELSGDDVRLDDVMFDLFVRKENKCDYICLLQPTSPLRSVKDIISTYKAVQKKKWSSVVTVQWNPIMGWVKEPSKAGSMCLYQIHKRPNRQTRDNFYLENGAVYWVKQNEFLNISNRIISPTKTFVYEMPPERSLEVDTPYDWFLAEKTYEWMAK